MSNLCTRRRLVVTTLLTIPAFAACARTASTIRTAPTPAPRAFETVVVSVRSAGTTLKEDEQRQFSTLVVALLAEGRVAPNIVLGDSTTERPNAALLDLEITGARKVGPMQRALFGAFAGRASITVDLNMKDLATRQSFAEFTVKGETGSTGYSGTSNEALARAAQEVANLVAKHIHPAQ